VKSSKTADAGISLYAGMAVASLLGSGVVFSRKRKDF
jgi:LPXTG-motif cell wall anchor domain protein